MLSKLRHHHESSTLSSKHIGIFLARSRPWLYHLLTSLYVITGIHSISVSFIPARQIVNIPCHLRWFHVSQSHLFSATMISSWSVSIHLVQGCIAYNCMLYKSTFYILNYLLTILFSSVLAWVGRLALHQSVTSLSQVQELFYWLP